MFLLAKLEYNLKRLKEEYTGSEFDIIKYYSKIILV